MSESKAAMLSAVARHTGLHRETIKDLIKRGWTYEQKIGQPARWVAPEGQLKRDA